MSRIITPINRRKAMVASFPRSGTHFLMNTLELNFWHKAAPYVDLSGGIDEQFYGTNLAHFFEVLNINHKVPTIVKTHYEVDFFAQLATRQDTGEATSVLNIIHEWFDIFYIYRNMDDVMESYAKHLNATATTKNPRANPTAINGAELAKMEPWGSPMQHQMYQYPTFKDKWEAHVAGWHEAATQVPICIVKYEDLNERFEDEVERLSKMLSWPVLQPTRPSKHINVVKGAHFVSA